ncbi:hypothetical protein [Halosolutus halophilus]|uniref:hypothetical protein n=1 Tax=Halosolutus halophilus TaxID=1552990 RepID=UPI0022352165|nr:hypothetical protein [Halosolutus halophilus]
MRDNTDEEIDSNRRLSRRSYLTAAAAGTAAMVAAGTGMASEDDYEVVTVPAGGTFRRKLRDGDVLENVLIDISAKGAAYDIDARGSDWTIRNVGVKGAWDHEHPTSPIRVAADAGSTCRIENVYLGDGVIPDLPSSSNPTGIYAWWYHAGTIEIDRVNIQEHPDNGIYGSAPGNSSDHPNPGGGGELHVTNSYVRAGKTAGIRLGTDGSYAENCVVWSNAHRGFWGYYNDTELIDCDLGGSPTDIHAGSRSWNAGPSATVTVENCRFGSTNRATSSNRIVGSSAGKPEHRMPDGVPTSAEEAASGGDYESPTDEAVDELENTILVDGAGNNDVTRYGFAVSGSAERSTHGGASIDDEDTIDSGQVTGAVVGWRDAFRFSGELADLTVDGPARVIVNGEQVDPAEYGESSHEDDQDLPPNALVIDGSDADGNTSYSFTVDGEVISSSYRDASVDSGDEIDGRSVTGTVEDWIDAYWFDGDIVDFTLAGNASVDVEYNARQ